MDDATYALNLISQKNEEIALLRAEKTKLLEALELALFVRGTRDDTSEVRNKMEQAIAKARGTKQ